MPCKNRALPEARPDSAPREQLGKVKHVLWADGFDPDDLTGNSGGGMTVWYSAGGVSLGEPIGPTRMTNTHRA
jgi:hypothetical protein